MNCASSALLLALTNIHQDADFVVPWRQEVEWAESQASAILARTDEASDWQAAHAVGADAERFVDAHPEHWMDKRLMISAGAALARNGDAASALAFWRRAQRLADASGGYGIDSSVLDDHLASVLELQHQWREALAVRLRWNPKSSCGNCEWALTRERAAAISRCLIRLGRAGEAGPWIRQAHAPDPFIMPRARTPQWSIWQWHPHW